MENKIQKPLCLLQSIEGQLSGNIARDDSERGLVEQSFDLCWKGKKKMVWIPVAAIPPYSIEKSRLWHEYSVPNVEVRRGWLFSRRA